MATATAEDQVVRRLTAITIMLTDPQRKPYWRRWEARAIQLAERADPLNAPPAGVWMRGSRPGDRWHVSSGLAEQSINGLIASYYLVIPACNRRYDVRVDLPNAAYAGFVQGTDTFTIGQPDSERCARCVAIDAGTAKPAHWQEDES